MLSLQLLLSVEVTGSVPGRPAKGEAVTLAATLRVTVAESITKVAPRYLLILCSQGCLSIVPFPPACLTLNWIASESRRATEAAPLSLLADQ